MDSNVQELFRRAAAGDDASAMREGLEQLLGLGEHGGLSPEREYELRCPGFVLEMPQSRERVRGRDAMRAMQQQFPAPPPALTLRRVVGAGRVWVAEGDIAYCDDRWQVVVIFELDGRGLIARETRYYTKAFEAPAWRADLVEAMG